MSNDDGSHLTESIWMDWDALSIPFRPRWMTASLTQTAARIHVACLAGFTQQTNQLATVWALRNSNTKLSKNLSK